MRRLLFCCLQVFCLWIHLSHAMTNPQDGNMRVCVHFSVCVCAMKQQQCGYIVTCIEILSSILCKSPCE